MTAAIPDTAPAGPAGLELRLGVRHRRVDVSGVDTFYREAGPEDAPVLLLPHGYPCSSFEFRNLMPRLADRWRLLGPDYPGMGYSATPEDFDYSLGNGVRFIFAR